MSDEMILKAKEKPKSKLKWLLLSFQHVFAMFGATIFSTNDDRFYLFP